MFYFVALASAALYGAADFIGGLTSRRADTLAIVVISQFAGMVLLGIALPLLPQASPARADVGWGAAAGLTGGLGVALLYRALAVGTMSVVAPVTAVCAVVIPVAAAVLLGERPAPPTIAGIGLAIVAIVLVSQASNEATAATASARTSGIGLALASGVAIGLFFLTLSRTSASAGMWPLLVARVVSVALFGALALAGRRPFRMPPRVAVTVVGGGALDMLANLLYLIATRMGPLSVAVTLSSLYPASTVVLARIVLGERLSARQTAGIVCAMVAVVLIVGR